MFTRAHAAAALGCAALLLSGCGSRPAPEGSAAAVKKKTEGVQAITLHVDGMTQRLGLF
jgi:hypothetical protein